MTHEYFGIYDKAAKAYVHISESKNAAMFIRMCEAMAKDEKTFMGVKPDDFTASHLATFEDETGKFTSYEPEKIWEGKPNA